MDLVVCLSFAGGLGIGMMICYFEMHRRNVKRPVSSALPINENINRYVTALSVYAEFSPNFNHDVQARVFELWCKKHLN